MFSHTLLDPLKREFIIDPDLINWLEGQFQLQVQQLRRELDINAVISRWALKEINAENTATQSWAIFDSEKLSYIKQSQQMLNKGSC